MSHASKENKRKKKQKQKPNCRLINHAKAWYFKLCKGPRNMFPDQKKISIPKYQQINSIMKQLVGLSITEHNVQQRRSLKCSNSTSQGANVNQMPFVSNFAKYLDNCWAWNQRLTNKFATQARNDLQTRAVLLMVKFNSLQGNALEIRNNTGFE